MKRYRKRRNKLATITAVQAWLAADCERLFQRQFPRDWDDDELPIAFGRGGRRKRKARARGTRPLAGDFPF